jgi:hypothetical protein
MQSLFGPSGKIVAPARVSNLKPGASGNGISTSPQTRVIDHSLNAAFIDCFTVYDFSSPGRQAGMVAGMENTYRHARDKKNASIDVSGPERIALGGLFWIGNPGGGSSGGRSGIR